MDTLDLAANAIELIIKQREAALKVEVKALINYTTLKLIALSKDTPIPAPILELFTELKDKLEQL